MIAGCSRALALLAQPLLLLRNSPVAQNTQHLFERVHHNNYWLLHSLFSSYCWRSLASIACREDATEDGITIQRIECGKPKAVAFTQKEIVIAAEREIEVR